MNPSLTSTVTLRAIDGWPLADDRICEMVVSTARAIAERTGVEIVNLATTDSSVTASIKAGRIEAIGFAAELRRLTNSWYEHKFGGTLWGEARQNDDEAGEAWKRA